jgi:hypothetical protein
MNPYYESDIYGLWNPTKAKELADPLLRNRGMKSDIVIGAIA